MSAWPNHQPPYDFLSELSKSLGYICAFTNDRLIGFINIAWDGGKHAFLLDTTVHKEFQRKGIGTQLVHKASNLAKSNNVEWFHVDYEPGLANFYTKAGFKPTEAGLLNLKKLTQ
ncbi:MAG: GNAT family N-acetyltransferase [Pseudomonadota bacterium]